MNPSPESPAGVPDAVARLARSVVGVATRRAQAAGVVWRDGVVVSAAHPLWCAREVRVVLPGGEALAATVKGADAGTDLAVLALDIGATPPVEPGPDVEWRIGDFVFAVARDASGVPSASFGHLGKVGGAWRSWRGAPIDRLLRLDGGLYPGFAGAPVADAGARLLGIATPMLSRTHGVVVPVPTVERVVTQLLAHGRVAHGWLGVALQPVRLSPAQAAQAGAGAGLLVTSVADGAPAAAAGVQVGDIVVALGGSGTASIEALREALAAARLGARLPLVVLRGGQRVELSVEVVERERR